jgi:hypothetical protein
MLKRTMAVVFAMLVVMAAGSAVAQCTVGVYADANGTVNVAGGFRNGDQFHVYVVLFTENVVSAVSYGLDVPGLNTDIFIQELSYGASGNGINVLTANGNNVGLGECAVGFGGLPVMVTDYTMFMPFWAPPRTLNVVPNPDENSSFPVMADCTGNLSTCDAGQSLVVETPVAVEASSFGAVKGLYNN